MSCKVSVIIPAYNAEKTVIYAVRSALAQTLSDVEIIVIDDASTDGTLSVLRDAFEDCESVRILSQPENAGVSAARNRGMREASGKYIAFLDSDDAMLPDMLSRMYSAAEEHGSDVLHTTGCLLAAAPPDVSDISGLDDSAYKPLTLEKRDGSSGVSHAPRTLRERLDIWYAHGYHWAVWNKLFRRSFIEKNNVTFDPLHMAEDMIFCFKALVYAEEYTVLPGNWYIYRMSAVSLSRGAYSPEKVKRLTLCQLRAAQAICRFTSETAFFTEHPAECVKVHRMICDSLDTYYIAPALAQLGAQEVQNSGTLTALFDEEFGEKSAFVGYLFWRLHDLMNEGKDAARLSDYADRQNETKGNHS